MAYLLDWFLYICNDILKILNILIIYFKILQISKFIFCRTEVAPVQFRGGMGTFNQLAVTTGIFMR